MKKSNTVLSVILLAAIMVFALACSSPAGGGPPPPPPPKISVYVEDEGGNRSELPSSYTFAGSGDATWLLIVVTDPDTCLDISVSSSFTLSHYVAGSPQEDTLEEYTDQFGEVPFWMSCPGNGSTTLTITADGLNETVTFNVYYRTE
jgi:hypothetical protein